MSAKQMFAPNGLRIVGQVDIIIGIAQCSEATRKKDRTLEPEWEGGTDVDWDSQTSMIIKSGRLSGQKQFKDENAGWWPESLVSLEGEPLKIASKREGKK